MQYIKSINLNLLIILIFTSFSCFSQHSYEEQKKDTIYIYFKHKKNEVANKPFLFSPPDWYGKRYSFFFPKIKKGNIQKMYYSFLSLTHQKGSGKKRELPIIVKNKKYLKKIKDKTYTYCDFRNKTYKELAVFYNQNRNRILYLIDKKETKKGEIYLKRVSFETPIPVIK